MYFKKYFSFLILLSLVHPAKHKHHKPYFGIEKITGTIRHRIHFFAFD
jgi:hypothetical protein